MVSEYGKETLSLEFKSDRKCLPDDDLLDAVVALANSDGGTVYLGVEDDGVPTGLHMKHRDATGLAAMIANRTVPPVSARTQIVGSPEVPVMQIDVPKSRSGVVSTKSGKILRRRMKVDGTPESIPMYPYEIATRLSDLGRLDFSAQPVPDATRDDFDPVERERLRRIIGTYQSSDRNLLELADEELEQALQLTVTVDGKSVPTLTGLLLLGREESLKRLVPTHRASFQVLSGTDIKVNQDYNGPLLKTIEQINDMFSPWNPSVELSIGLFSTMVPEFDHRAFREALVNAFGHRDYTLLGRVRVQMGLFACWRVGVVVTQCVQTGQLGPPLTIVPLHQNGKSRNTLFHDRSSCRTCVVYREEYGRKRILSALLLEGIRTGVMTLSPVLVSIARMLPMVLVPFSSDIVLSLTRIRALSLDAIACATY